MQKKPYNALKSYYHQARELRLSAIMEFLRGKPRYWLRIFRHTFRLFMDNRGQYQANALAFRTMVSLVPMLAFAISFSIFMGLDITSKLKGMLERYLALDQAMLEQIFNLIDQFQEQAREGTVVGFLVLLAASLFLINAIEVAFNNIWHVTRRRPYTFRILSYIAMTVLIPVLMGISIYMTTQLQVDRVGDAFGEKVVSKYLPFAELAWINLREFLVPLVLVWLLFLAMYKWLPNTRVENRAAILASLLVAIAFELCKWGFSVFAARMVVSRQLWWGSLGVFLVFLMWVYVIWWLVLFGAQLGYVFQNYRYVFLRGHTLEGRVGEAQLSLRIMLVVSRLHLKGEHGPTVRELAERLEVDVPRIQKILDRMIESNMLLLAPGTNRGDVYDDIYVPGIDLGSLTLADVLKKSTDFWEGRPDEDLLEIETGRQTAKAADKDLAEQNLERLLLKGRGKLETTLSVPVRELFMKEFSNAAD
ncbi:MAG: YihY/virulence factor BrkB family protein [bacterium]